MASTGPADSAVENLPARWIDVAADATSVHNTVRAAMERHHYKPHGTPADGVAMYRFGSPGAEFVSDALSLGLVLRLMKRPDGWAELAAWTVPTEGGVRLSVSLVKGVFHAEEVRTMITEIIETFRSDGTLVDASERFSSRDLPKGTTGSSR